MKSFGCAHTAWHTGHRGVINGKTAVLPKYSDTLIISQPEGADYHQHIGCVFPNKSRDYVPGTEVCT